MEFGSVEIGFRQEAVNCTLSEQDCLQFRHGRGFGVAGFTGFRIRCQVPRCSGLL